MVCQNGSVRKVVRNGSAMLTISSYYLLPAGCVLGFFVILSRPMSLQVVGQVLVLIPVLRSQSLVLVLP